MTQGVDCIEPHSTRMEADMPTSLAPLDPFSVLVHSSKQAIGKQETLGGGLDGA